MPSPAANALTQAHRAQQAQISAAVARSVLRSWGVVNSADLDRSWPAVSELLARIITNGYAQSSSTAAAYLRAHARLDGVTIRTVELPPRLAAEQVATVLRVTGPVAYKRAVGRGRTQDVASRIAAGQLAGGATRLALLGGRGTIDRTVRRSSQIVGYRRVGSGSSCHFCALLVSRGAVYKASTALGVEPYHDHCDCTAEPLYRNEPEPAEVQALYDRYKNATEGLSGQDALNAWRKAYSPA